MRKQNYSYTLSEEVIEKLKAYSVKNGGLSLSSCVEKFLREGLSDISVEMKKDHEMKSITGPYVESEKDKEAEKRFLSLKPEQIGKGKKKTQEDIDFEKSIADAIAE